MNTRIDMSHELTLHRHHHGVQLRRPTYHDTELTLGDISQKRISVFFKDQNHVLLNANNHQLECINMLSLKDIVGKKFIDVIDDTRLNRTIENNNNHVMKTQKTLFFHENIETNQLCTKAISIKMPLYGMNNEVLGIFGFAYITETPCAPSSPLAFSETLNQFFDATQTTPECEQRPTLYSTRETDLIHFILRGKTIQESAHLMDISARTAEHYFANIKHKAGVKTRSALVDVLINQGFKVA